MRMRSEYVKGIMVPFLRDRTTRRPPSSSVQVPIQLNAGNRWYLVDVHTYCGRNVVSSLQLTRIDASAAGSPMYTDNAWHDILHENGFTTDAYSKWLREATEVQAVEVNMTPWTKRSRA